MKAPQSDLWSLEGHEVGAFALEGERSRGVSPLSFSVIGLDEVGRGCLAGPVVAASALVPSETWAEVARGESDAGFPWWEWVMDSKQLSEAQRKRLAPWLWKKLKVQVAWGSAEEIDEINILRASLKAMRSCLASYRGWSGPVVVRVDGHLDPCRSPFVPAEESVLWDQWFPKRETWVKGDARSFSIAAASVVAKVFRDSWMEDLEEIFPGYGFAKHKGYPTPVHKAALKSLGLSAIHRHSFCKSLSHDHIGDKKISRIPPALSNWT